MNLKLLLISAEDFPAKLAEHMSDYGFRTVEARGRLKIKSLLESERFDAIAWCYEGYELSLASDLLETLNQRDQIPLILLTGNLESPSIETDIKGPFGVLDLADEPADLLKAIEYACRKPSSEDGAPLQEIDFKNLVREVTLNKGQYPNTQPQSFKLQSAWLAVDDNEKRLLAAQEEYPRSLWRRILTWLKT